MRQEVGRYQPELLERPSLIVGTKDDSVPPEVLESWSHVHMSSITTNNVRTVLNSLAELVSRARAEEVNPESTIIMRPLPENAWVERTADNEFRVHGRAAERVVALNDVTSPEALNYIDDRLNKLGVNKLLSRAGARDGDVVWIAQFSFEYHSDM